MCNKFSDERLNLTCIWVPFSISEPPTSNLRSYWSQKQCAVLPHSTRWASDCKLQKSDSVSRKDAHRWRGCLTASRKAAPTPKHNTGTWKRFMYKPSAGHRCTFATCRSGTRPLAAGDTFVCYCEVVAGAANRRNEGLLFRARTAETIFLLAAKPTLEADLTMRCGLKSNERGSLLHATPCAASSVAFVACKIPSLAFSRWTWRCVISRCATACTTRRTCGKKCTSLLEICLPR